MELKYSANIVIASSGQEAPQIFETPFGEIRSRDGASLKFTTNDAESIFDFFKRKTGDYVPEDFHSLLIDPTLSQVEQTIKQLSIKLAKFPKGDPGLSLYFAGHGKQGSGNLVLKDGTLSPTRFLDLQQKEVTAKNGGYRGIGIILDSCYSGAFLLRLALECDRRFNEFSLYEGLVSCLPDEKSFELSFLEHGAFTYTFLNPGNKSVNFDEFNRAILEQDYPIIARGLQGAVANMGNATAFLTQGRQFSASLTKYRITVPGYTEIELESERTFEELSRNLTKFKNSI